VKYLIEIFCILDEFCKYFTPELKKHMVDTSGKRRRNRPCRLSDSEVMTILVLFLQTCALGKCTGISIIDSTPLVSCHIKRMHMHKTMKGWAAKGKCTMGWFWQLTPGNVDDRAPLKDSRFTEKLFGKLFADRGYFSQDLFEMQFVDDIHLVTKIKKNMKDSLYATGVYRQRMEGVFIKAKQQ